MELSLESWVKMGAFFAFMGGAGFLMLAREIDKIKEQLTRIEEAISSDDDDDDDETDD